AVALERLLLRRGPHESLEIAARMQALSAPVGGRQERRPHLAPVGHPRLPVLVRIELARDAVLVEIAAVLSELLLPQGLPTPHPIAVDGALVPRAAAPGLHLVALPRRRVRPEAGAEGAAGGPHVAGDAGGAPPAAHGGEMLRLPPRRLPLVLCVVGDAVEPDLAVAPRLRSRP